MSHNPLKCPKCDKELNRHGECENEECLWMLTDGDWHPDESEIYEPEKDY